MKYLLCYTERYDNGNNMKAESETFDDFADAVVRYTVDRGGRDNVVLAETDSGRIISQFSRSRSSDGSEFTPDSVFIR